jgi:hypothetical protein
MDFISENSNFLIILFYAYILFFRIKDSNYLAMILLTLVSATAICINKKIKEGVENNNNNNNNNIMNSNSVQRMRNSNENSYIKNRGDNVSKTKVTTDEIKAASFVDRMGPYDGLCLRTENNKFINLDNNKLVNNEKIMNYLGVQGPIENVYSKQTDLIGPTVDGDPNSPQSLFLFKNNISSLNCCPGTYSTSTGCICPTNKQQKFINSRGNNKIGPDSNY